MPVELLISNQKFFNQITNDANFGSNLTDYTPNIVGGVGERIRLTFNVDVRWYFTASASSNLIVTGTGTDYKRNTGSWAKDGFSVWDTVQMSSYGIDTILSISSDGLTMITNGGASTPDNTYVTFTMYGTNDLTALIYKFGLIDNSENFNTINKVSLNEQAYYVAGINHSTPTFKDFTKLGNYKDWITCEPDGVNPFNQKVKWVSTVGQYQKFNIETDLIINPFYLQDFITDFENGTTPFLFAGSNSLKYVFECQFLTALSNPNTAKIGRIENNLGSIAWYDENFNGFTNNYSVDSITYKDSVTSGSCAGLQVGKKTKATITLSAASPVTFKSGANFGVYVSRCSPATSYQNTVLTNMEENFIFDNAINAEGAATTTGINSIIKSCVAKISTGKLIIEAEFEYTAAQQLLIESGDKFVIAVCVADDTLSAGNSDKVMLLADYTYYVASADISDLFGITNFEVFEHIQNPVTGIGQTDFKGIIEEGIVIKFNFWLDIGITKDASLNTLKFRLLAYKDSTHLFDINVYDFIFVTGVILGIDTLRGYKLESTDYFNKVKVDIGVLTGDKQYYNVYIAQKISWQDWIKNINVDTVFYNSTKPNNNLNFKTSNYSGLNSYQIKLAVAANVNGLSTLGTYGNTEYLINSPDIEIKDYEANPNWTYIKKLYNEAGTIDFGVISKTENTLFRATWTRSSAFNPGYNFTGILRIEEANENGYNIYELSNRYTPVTNCLLKPVSGETKAKVTVNPITKTVIVEGLIDFTKLSLTKEYFLSCHIDDGTGLVPFNAILNEDGTPIRDENGNFILAE